MSASTGASSKAASFNTRQGMESGPDTLLGLILLRSLCTPWTSTTISGIEGKTSPGGVGMVSALDWLSENSRPPSLIGDVPVLSQRLALTNLQNGLVPFWIKAQCLWYWWQNYPYLASRTDRYSPLHDLYFAHMVSLCFPVLFLAFLKRHFSSWIAFSEHWQSIGHYT